LAFGVLTFLTRLWLIVGIGRDKWGLLDETSFPAILSWIFVALTMAVLGLGVWKMERKKLRTKVFPAPVPAIGMILTAICFGYCSVMGFSAEVAEEAKNLANLCNILGLLAAGALVFLAWCQWKGKCPNMLLHSLVCVYLMVYLVSHYQLWTSTPQLQGCFFEMLAIVCVMLACYQRAAADIGEGSRRNFTFFSCAALFFSLATLPDWNEPVFFIGCAIWMFFTTCKMPTTTPKEN
jgi:chromate transport protein ChrA